jgi:hypothetical protein
MKKLFILLVALSFIGCTGWSNFVSDLGGIPEGCEESPIYKAIPMADLAKGPITVMLDQVNNEGYRSWALSMNKKAIEVASDPNSTYSDFALKIFSETMEVNKWWGSEIVALSAPIFNSFTGDYNKMDDCTRSYIISFCTMRLNTLEAKYPFFDGSQLTGIRNIEMNLQNS